MTNKRDGELLPLQPGGDVACINAKTPVAQSALDNLLTKATDPNIDADKLEKLMGLYERFEDRRAEKAFNEALADFQKECPTITMNQKVDFDSKKQSSSRVNFGYATFSEMVHAVKPILTKFGLSFSFSTEEAQNKMKMVTIISHVEGHKREFTSHHEGLGQGGTTAGQKRRGAYTTAKRTALELALGLVIVDSEDEKRHSIDTEITEEQLAEIDQLLKDTDTNLEDFEGHMKVSTLKLLSHYEGQKAINALKTKRRVLIEAQTKRGKDENN